MGDVNYGDLIIALDGNTFTGIVFNLNIANPTGGPPDSGTANFTVNYVDSRRAARL